MRIGIPRSLLYYRYFPLWETFFKELGVKIVVSPKTNKDILEKGLKLAIDEYCLPIKAMYGHVLELKDKVDYVFLPRVVSLMKKTYTCPKIVAIPDTISALIPDLKFITTTINLRRYPLFISFLNIGLKLKKSPLRIIGAYRKAVKKQEEHEKELIRQGEAILGRGEKIKIAVISHAYNLNDSYTNGNLIDILKEMHLEPITPEMLPKEIIEKELETEHPIYWYYEREILGASHYLMKNKNISGIIYVVSFGCGPDSLIGEHIKIESKKYSKPFMPLVLDEHQSQTGLRTRIEAFVDLIKRKKHGGKR